MMMTHADLNDILSAHSSTSNEFGETVGGLDEDITSAVSPKISEMMYSPQFTSANMTPKNARAIINEWSNTGMQATNQYPVGGTFTMQDTLNSTQALQTGGVETGEEAIEAGEVVTDAIPGVGEALMANQILGQLTGSLYNSTYDAQLSAAQNYANTNLRYGAGASLNQSNYMAAVSQQVATEKSNMAFGSLLGPLGSVIAGGINSTVSANYNLDTTYSTGGMMINGTADASANTSTAPS